MGRLPGGVPTPAPAAGVTALVFRAGPLFCALPLGEVVETMRPLQTRPLAGAPPYVRGLTVLRGTPAPVIDLPRLLTGVPAPVDRYVSVRAGNGRIACATGPVIGVREVGRPPDGPDTPFAGVPAFTGVPAALIAAVGTIGTEPLLLLNSVAVLPDQVWAATDGTAAETAP